MVKKINEEQFLLELASRIKEQGNSPNIKEYRPHEPQYRFHSSTKQAKLYIGGNRSGKTTGGVVEDVWRALCRHPYRPELNAIGPNLGRVVAVDFDHGVGQILLPQFKQWLYPSALINGSWEDSYNKSTKILTLSNTSQIEFMSYDQDLDKFAGVPRRWIHFDEEPPRDIWGECMARLVDYDGDYWVTMTPVEGMTWVYDVLYEPNVDNADGDVEVIEVNTLQNPYVSQEGVKKLIKAGDEEDAQVRIGGTFVRKGGLIYKNFDPTPGAAQVLSDPILDPSKLFDSRNWMWVMGLDHGLNNPTAVLWMAIDPAGFCVLFDEYYQKERTVDQNANAIKEKIRKHGRFPDLLVADPSIQNRNPVTGTSVQEEYQKYGLSFVLGNNDVKAGVIRVKKYFNKHPYVGKKRHALDKVPEGVEGNDTFHMLRISPECGNLIWELKRYRWKTYQTKKAQYENNPYDEPHKKDDHACDALRYIIMTRPDLHASAGDVTANQIDSILNDLDQRLVMTGWDMVDDPNNLRSSPLYDPDQSERTGSAAGWEFDEHMGGLI